MKLSSLNILLLASGGFSSALVLERGHSIDSLATREASAETASAAHKKLLIGGGPTGAILAAEFDGTAFNIVANNTIEATSASWLLFKEPNLLYAVDENSDTTRLFNFDPVTNELVLVQNATGSTGVVFLEFNADKTRMIGAAFGNGTVDVWALSPNNGALTLLKTIVSDDALGPNVDRQDSAHPHQCLLDNSGRFFSCNDLGTDTVLIIDSQDDAFEITNRVRVDPPGCGPRHGAFFPTDTTPATHYVVVCEILSLVTVFELAYSGNTIQFLQVQTISTFGQDFPPVNLTSSTAGELTISGDNKDIYVSNRLTGNETDSISHFITTVDEETGSLTLEFADTVNSGGLIPRMFALSTDDDTLFSTNQDGEFGLLAFARDSVTGTLASLPAGAKLDIFGGPGFGPQFVMEI